MDKIVIQGTRFTFNGKFKAFGRTSPGNKSLVEFKSRWGCEMVDLAHFYYPGRMTKEMVSKEESWKYKSATKVCSGIPNALQKSVGHFCYRHLG